MSEDRDDAKLFDTLQDLAGSPDEQLPLLRKRFDAPIRALLKRLGVAESDIDDSAADIWLKIVRGLEMMDLRSPASLVSWVFTVTRNYQYSRTRTAARKSAPSIRIDELADVIPGHAAAPHDAAMFREQLRLVEARIAQLPHDQRFALRESIAGKPHKEIAAELGRKPENVSSLLQRARATLRAALDRLDAEHPSPPSPTDRPDVDRCVG